MDFFKTKLHGCLSILLTTMGNGWAYNQKEIAHSYQLCHRYMKHWEKVLPDNVFTVRYEDVVGNLEETITTVLDKLGLQWDAGCLDFHKGKSMIKTASREQVNKPIYTGSIDRAEKYRPYLDDLISALSGD